MNGIRRIKNICRVCKCQLSQQLHELRTWVLFFMLFLYLNGNMSAIKDFASSVQTGISPWLFPLLTDDMVCSLVLFCMWCFLICDAPFRKEEYLYYVGRIGKRDWICGEILFLILFAGIYVLAINLSLIIQTLPRLELTMEWGKTLGTLAYTDAAEQLGISVGFPLSIMSSMSPWQATLLSSLLAWAAAVILALLILAINWGFKTTMGVAAAIFWVLLDLTIYNIMNSSKWFRYSPITLSRLSSLMGGYKGITPLGTVLFFSGAFLGFIVIILIVTKMRKGIE